MGAQAERLSYDIRRGLLAHEEQFCVGGEPADLLRDLESMQLRQVDIEQNQLRRQFCGLLNSLQPIRRLDGLELRSSLKRFTHETAERPMVLHDENPQRHNRLVSQTERSRAEFTPDANSVQRVESISATGSSASASRFSEGQDRLDHRYPPRHTRGIGSKGPAVGSFVNLHQLGGEPYTLGRKEIPLGTT